MKDGEEKQTAGTGTKMKREMKAINLLTPIK
jgi:hypothetical protein